MHWQDALKQNHQTFATHNEQQASILAPSSLHQGYILRLFSRPDAPFATNYHAATREGCERLLEEMAVSKTGWQ